MKTGRMYLISRYTDCMGNVIEAYGEEGGTTGDVHYTTWSFSPERPSNMTDWPKDPYHNPWSFPGQSLVVGHPFLIP